MNDIYLNLEKLDPLNTDHANFKNPNYDGVTDNKLWKDDAGYCLD